MMATNRAYGAVVVVSFLMCLPALAEEDGPFYWDDLVNQWHRDVQNGGLITSNPNRGDDGIEYQVTNAQAETEQIAFEIGFSASSYAQTKFKRTTGATRTLSYSLSGCCLAPPAVAGTGACNHDEVFLAYELQDDKYTYKEYYTENGEVSRVTESNYAERTDYAIQLQSRKVNQENYGMDNFQRPNPYILNHKYWWQDPGCYVPVGMIGIKGTVAEVERDWT
ncbi:MAG: hypothetical protein ACOX5J_17550 [Candidatus Hydrogenedentales bacterium]|jgi:AraC-like DNA-binding protein